MRRHEWEAKGVPYRTHDEEWQWYRCRRCGLKEVIDATGVAGPDGVQAAMDGMVDTPDCDEAVAAAVMRS